MYDLVHLKQTCNDICEQAVLDPNRPTGSINWGDLSCTSVEGYLNSSNDVGYRVIIEEASPCAFELQEFIISKLAETGYSNIEVITVW